jgi:hypothetical protein
MKKVYYFLLVLAILITIPLSQVVTSKAQETASFKVATAAICTDVVDREPVDSGNAFEVSLGKVYCFTTIIGAHSPTEVTHVWYFGDVERARVNLAIKASSWRTYSSKRIQGHEIGDWHVDVLGPGGELLKTLQFKIIL